MMAVETSARFDLVIEWLRRESDVRYRFAAVRNLSAFAFILAGAVMFYAPAVQRWEGAGAAGLIFLLAALLLNVVPILMEEWRSDRPGSFPQISEKPPRADLHGEPALAGLSPRAQRLLHGVVGLDEREWDQVLAAARRNGVLSRRPDSAAIDRVLHSSSAKSRAEPLDDRAMRFSETVDASERWLTRTTEALDALVERGAVPFHAPYEKYRLAFALLLSFLIIEHEERPPATPLEVFAVDLAGRVEEA